MGLIEVDFEQLSKAQTKDALLEMVDQGMSKEAIAVAMHDIWQFSTDRIAYEFDMPPEKSKEMVIKGRQVLREIIFGEVTIEK